MKTCAQAARMLAISQQRLRVLATDKRIPDAHKHGRAWVFPDNPIITTPKGRK
jgi:hypothetical protein